MKVIYDDGKVKDRLVNTVAAIGIFDGVHLGHQSLIRQMVKTGKDKKLKTLVITFHPHPAQVLRNVDFEYLTSLPHRIELMECLGVDVVWVIRFTKKFAHLQPQQFIERYLIKKFGVREVFVGDDFRFGENRTGDVSLFERMGEECGFKVHHIHTVKKTEHKISSSRLRDLIHQGKLKEASRLLGRDVSVFGQVIKGKGLGKEFGFPTANIDVKSGMLPAKGVYVVKVFWKGKALRGVCNIGVRPSVSDGAPGSVLLEVHLLDFTKNIYREDLTVVFLKSIRNEKKFPSVTALISQIRLDEKSARQYFQKNPLSD